MPVIAPALEISPLSDLRSEKQNNPSPHLSASVQDGDVSGNLASKANPCAR
jgi:hypothetical protein